MGIMTPMMGGGKNISRILGVGGIPFCTQYIKESPSNTTRKTYSCLEDYTFAEDAILIDLQCGPCRYPSYFDVKSRYRYTAGNNNFNINNNSPVGTDDTGNQWQIYVYNNNQENIVYGSAHAKLEIIRANGSEPFEIVNIQNNIPQSSPTWAISISLGVLDDDIRNIIVHKGDKLRYDFAYDISLLRAPSSGIIAYYACGFGVTYRKKIIME